MAMTRRMAKPLETDENDALLTAWASAGDERAFAQLYARHAHYVAGVAYRLLGGDHEVDDVVQDTFLAALEHLPELTDPAAVRPWLASIAARKAMRRFDARGRFKRFLQSLTATAAPRSEVHSVLEVSALARALGKMTPERRIPWVLHRVEGQTLPSVAEVMGVSLATVKRRIAEAEVELGELKEVAHASG